MNREIRPKFVVLSIVESLVSSNLIPLISSGYTMKTKMGRMTTKVSKVRSDDLTRTSIPNWWQTPGFYSGNFDGVELFISGPDRI
jgi:hypothetical protein